MKAEIDLSKQELCVFRETLLSKYHEIGWHLKLTDVNKSEFKKMVLQYENLRLVLNQINNQLENN